MSFLSNFWDLVIESAPWLLVGYLLAGVIKQLIPSSWVEKQLASTGFGSIVKGAFIGAPLPLCSCGVIPASLAIRKAGASKGATSSFMVATPETGVDSIAFSYAVLGPIFAIARPIGALFSAIVAGVLVMLFDREDRAPAASAVKSACCASGDAAGQTRAGSVAAESVSGESGCCASNAAAEPDFGEKLLGAFRYGYGRMIEDTAMWLAIGLIAAAVVTTVVPESFFLRWGDGLLAMLIMVLVGLPMYICATASTPVAASLLFAGISPGAALVFMLTGPATNIATMGVIKQHLGSRSLLAYLVGVIGAAIACGLLLNSLYAAFAWPLQLNLMSHGETWPLWRQAAAVLLLLLVLRVWLQAPLWRALQSLRGASAGGSQGQAGSA